MNSVTTLVEDQNPEGNKAGSHQENHACIVNKMNINCQLFYVCPIICALPVQYKFHSPSGLRAEALGIFFWQMVISN